MADEVYANNMEISCKASSGKSICAFPDVCFTPPQTPATPPGVPIPYPNTSMSSDTSDGSSTVTISGAEVMLKSKSSFKKSMGDEAGCAPKKGLINSQNTGKVYFKAWSMDVMIEGENVVRHLDLTTHNHASDIGNESSPWPQVERMAMPPKRSKLCKSNCPKKPSDERAKQLRSKTPSEAAQARANKGKKPLTCATCKKKFPSLAADHIVPLKRISRMPGFACLPPKKQEEIVNSEWNFVGICTSCNSSKCAKLWHQWSGVKKTNLVFDKGLIQSARKLTTDIFVNLFVTIQKAKCA